MMRLMDLCRQQVNILGNQDRNVTYAYSAGLCPFVIPEILDQEKCKRDKFTKAERKRQLDPFNLFN